MSSFANTVGQACLSAPHHVCDEEHFRSIALEAGLYPIEDLEKVGFSRARETGLSGIPLGEEGSKREAVQRPIVTCSGGLEDKLQHLDRARLAHHDPRAHQLVSLTLVRSR